ncbi:hypothetical protein [Porphyrobacter sp. ULC335]|uniref:hypothetical protein n=1 Tax=Porphyrobacter sp. ULC335 TaxID=2854260 RepID=UPI0022205EED|nr:hypothetical protein [Porphyrobacter sp. ULC335]UYV16869.1 hypothetical protein KVF90_06100 [Porphyrobacter sp. ULC335]
MTATAATTPSESTANSGGSPPAGWEALRADGDVQFAPVTIPEIPPRQPGWFEKMLVDLLSFLGDLLAPLGRALGGNWWWLQWVLLGAVVLLAVVLLVRLIAPGFGRKGPSTDGAEEEWRPDEAASLALLEDADRLAAEGRFDEATHLLLQRSVGQIAAVRPDWVEPSSTARELAVLPALPEAARTAFGVIAARVERSLFALSALDRADWEAARGAYAQFALARLDQPGKTA